MVTIGTDLRCVLVPIHLKQNPPAGRGTMTARHTAQTARRETRKTFQEDAVKNFRRFSTAIIFATVFSAAMATFSPTLHAAVPGSDHSISVRCALLNRALDAAIANFGSDSALANYLRSVIADVCGQ